MPNFFHRLKTLWKLSKKDKTLLSALDGLSDKEIMELPDEDTKAVFFGEGTTEEFEDLKKEDSGIKAWYDRIKRLGQTRDDD